MSFQPEREPTLAELNIVRPDRRPTRDIGGLGLTLAGNKFPLITESDAQFDAYVGYPDIQADFVFVPVPALTMAIKRSKVAC